MKKRKPPKIQALGNIRLPAPGEFRLDNGITVYHLNQLEQEVFQLDIVVDAGRPYELSPLVSRLTQLMLREGSGRVSGEALAEGIDYYGGTLRFPFDLDTITIQISGLHKHFHELVTRVADVLMEPAFRQNDLDRLVNRSVAQLKVELDKNETVAYREVTALLFGDQHPYGYNGTETLYRKVTTDQLGQHFKRCFHAGSIRLFLAGRVDGTELSILNKTIGQFFAEAKANMPKWPQAADQMGRFVFPGQGPRQAAMRLGRRLFNRTHPDFYDLNVLNTVLGGYFGSRLMANVREEKGFTYNIYSSLDTMRFDGCWLIALETSPETAEASLTEIYKEMEKLQREPLGQEEIKMVQNYLLGTMLSQVDGPLLTMEVVAGLINDGLTLTFFAKALESIHRISPERLQELAKAYLNPSDWTLVEVTPAN